MEIKHGYGKSTVLQIMFLYVPIKNGDCSIIIYVWLPDGTSLSLTSTSKDIRIANSSPSLHVLSTFFCWKANDRSSFSDPIQNCLRSDERLVEEERTYLECACLHLSLHIRFEHCEALVRTWSQLQRTERKEQTCLHIAHRPRSPSVSVCQHPKSNFRWPEAQVVSLRHEQCRDALYRNP